MRALLFFALVIGVFLVVLIISQRIRAFRAKQEQEDAHTQPEEPMVKCQHCGTHLPQKEAIVNEQGEIFCSQQHLELHHKP